MTLHNSFHADVLSLGVTQIYLSSRKIDALLQWFYPADVDTYPPLPVFDFGDGLRLTDGHTRAYVAYRMGVKSVPVVMDCSEIVTGKLGQQLYRADSAWAKRHGIRDVSGLADRVVTEEAYNLLWKRRCERSHNLLIQADDAMVGRLMRELEGYYLYGADRSLSEFYYEDAAGRLYVLKEGAMIPES